ncbi:MAG: pyrrolo-quinoline quinone, partial [Thermoleophilia bacterium]|nr:pyrrolo-quinoline quinone [Thermoleophilia bacterium]
MATSSWIFKTSGKILAQPLIVENTAYFGCDDGSMNAVEIGGGEEKWRFITRGRIVSAPVFDSGTIFFG